MNKFTACGFGFLLAFFFGCFCLYVIDDLSKPASKAIISTLFVFLPASIAFLLYGLIR